MPENSHDSSTDNSQLSDSSGDERLEPKGFLSSEDWWAVWLGGFILLAAFGVVYVSQSQQASKITLQSELISAHQAEWTAEELLSRQEELQSLKAESGPLKGWISKPQKWVENPAAAFQKEGRLHLLPIVSVFARSAIAVWNRQRGDG